MAHYLVVVLAPSHIEIPLDTIGVYGNCHIHNGITFLSIFFTSTIIEENLPFIFIIKKTLTIRIHS